jgi:hypothetical protein
LQTKTQPQQKPPPRLPEAPSDIAAEVAKALAPEIRNNTAVMEKLIGVLEGLQPKKDTAKETAEEVLKALQPDLQDNTEMLERLSSSIDKLSANIARMNSVPRPTGEGPRVAPVWPRYPVRPQSTWWTGCDGWQHLTQGDHAGLFDSAWLQTLSNAEIQSLHSDHHDEMQTHKKRVQWEHVVLAQRASTIAQQPLRRTAPVVMRLPPEEVALAGRRERRRHRRAGLCPNGLCPR